MTIRVLMLPHVTRLGAATSGIARVVQAYSFHLRDYDIEMVPPDATTYDLSAVHAGMTGAECVVCHCHGMYWSADYDSPDWEYSTNAKVIAAIRHARQVTVPSRWVAETFQRDMHFSPHVVPHGIDWQNWQHSEENGGYVLYNKNRQGDVCDSSPIATLAERFPDLKFVTTFAPENATGNVKATGVLSPPDMKRVVQSSGIYLSTTKETFGIGILEAMASGVPILGYAHGGILDLVQHGVNGYLAVPGDLTDLVDGLSYCLAHSDALGANGRELARRWTWEAACEKVALIYELALTEEPSTVAVVIPSYNYAKFVSRAVESAMRQTYSLLTDIIVVDDASDDDGATKAAVEALIERDSRVHYIRHDARSGVAVARNTGISQTNAKYISCLDADDAMIPTFLEKLIPALKTDSSLGVAYSGLFLVTPEGKEQIGRWPGPCNFDEQLRGENQVPTCNVFRRELWQRLGGYRQRYAPDGCGTEDAEFWLRAGAMGWGISKVTDEPLLLYTLGGRTSDREHRVVDYTAWHPWTHDSQHPFASIATPERHSHPVRQYDEPIVSVVIPVGPGHEEQVVNALDSLEAQTFRKWEVTVVFDGGVWSKSLKEAYPYARFMSTACFPYDAATVPCGTGKARNFGAKRARAPFLLFLDADDWLYPRALESMLDTFSGLEHDSAIYSESVGIMAIDEKHARTFGDDLLEYADGQAVIRNSVADYRYDDAVSQPFADRPYFWCYVSTLIPTSWHFEVGGFDEEMPAWEDWDYWLRIARLGKPFVPVHEPLLVYRFYSGDRREKGRQIKDSLLQYMQDKFSHMEEPMPCRGCGQRSTQNVVNPVRPVRAESVQSSSTSSDSDFVLCKLTRNKRGAEHIYGAAVFSSEVVSGMRRCQGGWRMYYGHRDDTGAPFLVHWRDVETMPNWFTPVERVTGETRVRFPEQRSVPALPPPPTTRESSPAPDVAATIIGPEPRAVELSGDVILPDADVILPVLEPGFDAQLIPGISSSIAVQLEADGISSLSDLVALGSEGLQQYKGIGAAKAETILDAAVRLQRGTLSPPPQTEEQVIAEMMGG